MGLKHVARVDAIPRGMLTSSERFVLVELAVHTNDKRDGWAHGYDVLAAKTEMAPRTLRRHLANLEAAGFIARMKQKRLESGGMGRVTIVLTIDTGIQGEGTKPFRQDVAHLREWEETKYATN